MDTSFFCLQKYVFLYFPSSLEYHSGFLYCISCMCHFGFSSLHGQHQSSALPVWLLNNVMMGCFVWHLLVSPCYVFVHPTVSSSFHMASLRLQAELWKWRLKFHLNPGDKIRAEWITWDPWCWQLAPRLGLYWIISGSLCLCSFGSSCFVLFFMPLKLDSNKVRGDGAEVFCFHMMETNACMLSVVTFGQVGWLQWHKSDFGARNRKHDILKESEQLHCVHKIRPSPTLKHKPLLF